MKYIIFSLSILLFANVGFSQCRDTVVLIHGNGGDAADWNNTYNELINRGYQSSDIFIPKWGSSCVSCNNHSGSEELPVLDALSNAISQSCTGQIDVVAHSMGVTLGIKTILDSDIASQVDDFVGIAGAVRGLHSCGYYPFNVYTSTCGYWGLSINSPFLSSIYNQSFANHIYSIKSWSDQVVCLGGCTVGGIHSSSIWGEAATYTYYLGHFGLQSYTATKQVDLIQ
ncbi:MAG: hypothetical protein R3E90_11025 [Marinicella sp.]